MGFQKKTGIDTFGEKYIYTTSKMGWCNTGYNVIWTRIVVTQLQMAICFNVVFNGGILYKPIIVDKIIHEEMYSFKKVFNRSKKEGNI